jgi:hypothetical protein
MNSLIIFFFFFISILIFLLRLHPIPFAEPFAEINVGATRRAERPVFFTRRFFADGAGFGCVFSHFLFLNEEPNYGVGASPLEGEDAKT